MSKETPKKEDVSRRDFLGLASMGAALLSLLAVLGGTFRMTKATVHYEESRKFKIGKPAEFPVGTIKVLDDKTMTMRANGFFFPN